MTITDAGRVDFYVLAATEMTEKYRVACRIANKAYTQGLKVFMRTDDSQQSATLDKMLWTFSQNSFVPHTIYDAKTCNAEEHDSTRYPVLIGCGEPPLACADLLISLQQAAAADYTKFGRVAELIIDQAADKSAGRDRYRFYCAQGIEPQTHQIP